MPRLEFFSNSQFRVDSFQFKEYNPLINPRVHDIGKNKQKITNSSFRQTYSNFLKYLLEKRALDSKDNLFLALYLLLQERIDESLKVYAQIKEGDFAEEQLMLQYKYLSAYLDLYSDYPKFTKARAICEEYLLYPIFTWRNRFIDLANQIAEFDGEVTISKEESGEGEGQTQNKNDEVAKKTEYIEAELEGESVKVTFKNIEEYEMSFYKVDLEILFS